MKKVGCNEATEGQEFLKIIHEHRPMRSDQRYVRSDCRGGSSRNDFNTMQLAISAELQHDFCDS